VAYVNDDYDYDYKDVDDDDASGGEGDEGDDDKDIENTFSVITKIKSHFNPLSTNNEPHL
jgi:hypothetical protein